MHVPNGAHPLAPLAEFDFDLFDIFERGLEVSAPVTALPSLDVRYLQLGHDSTGVPSLLRQINCFLARDQISF